MNLLRFGRSLLVQMRPISARPTTTVGSTRHGKY